MEILENIFEVVYQEYKDYENFFKSTAPKIKQQREDFAKYAEENISNIDLVTEHLFEIEAEPQFYQNDLVKLQNRLYITYQTVKDVIEIPAEIKKEIEAFPQPKQIYTIKNGTAQEIDLEYIGKLKTEAKKQYSVTVKELVSRMGKKE